LNNAKIADWYNTYKHAVTAELEKHFTYFSSIPGKEMKSASA